MFLGMNMVPLKYDSLNLWKYVISIKYLKLVYNEDWFLSGIKVYNSTRLFEIN